MKVACLIGVGSACCLWAITVMAMPVEVARLEAVLDGDNLLVSTSSELKQINLAFVSPPLDWDPQAQRRLQSILQPGDEVGLRPMWGKTGYKVYAEVFTDENLSVNLLLVREGFSIVHKRWLTPANRDQYLQAEAEAKAQQAGIWKVAHSP